MLEVCFNDSLGGDLHYINVKKRRNRTVANDVLPIEFRLDCGDLSDGVFSEKRFKYLKNLSQDVWMGDEAFYTKKDWNNSQKALSTIKEIASQGKEIIFWLPLNPKAVCDFLFLITEINGFENISIINYNEKEIVRISENEYEKFHKTKIKLSEYRFNFITKRWKEICKHSETLRILINGSIVGVEEDFYDSFILSNLPDGEFCATTLMMDLYKANIRFGTDDFLIKRICNILRSDKVEIIGWKSVIQSPLDLYEQIYKKKSTDI